jgi:hypothetical protein
MLQHDTQISWSAMNAINRAQLRARRAIDPRNAAVCCNTAIGAAGCQPLDVPSPTS